MAVVKILQYPNPKLKNKAKKVVEFDEQVKTMIQDMFDTLYASKNCAALAATQLDFAEPWHITVIDFSPHKDQPLCLVNGEIIEQHGSHTEVEGCMSVAPGHIQAKVTRAAKIRVKALDAQGNPVEFDAEGFMAKCIQHELDHLQGKVYLDHLAKVKRRIIEVKLNKLRKKKS